MLKQFPEDDKTVLKIKSAISKELEVEYLAMVWVDGLGAKRCSLVFVENKLLVYCYSGVAQNGERIQVAFTYSGYARLPGTMRMSRAFDRIVMNSALPYRITHIANGHFRKLVKRIIGVPDHLRGYLCKTLRTLIVTAAREMASSCAKVV